MISNLSALGIKTFNPLTKNLSNSNHTNTSAEMGIFQMDKNRVNDELKKIYLDNLQSKKNYLEEEQWKKIAHQFHLSKSEFIFCSLDFVKEFSHSPLSHYKVGVAGIGKSQRLYFGTNIEFMPFPLNQSIHAEQCLVSIAYSHAEKELEEIYLTAFPCGHCRQFLREMVNYSEFKIYVLSKNKDEFFLLSQLLPNSFGPQDLRITEALFKDTAFSLVAGIKDKPKDISKGLAEKILSSIQRSFCPYSKNPSGVVLEFVNNHFIIGSYLESCAFNPSLSPLHMAYAQLALYKLTTTTIKAIYFIELEELNSKEVKQKELIRILAKECAPQAKFRSFEAVRKINVQTRLISRL